MDSIEECRAIDFDNMYFSTFGCYPEDEIYEDEDGEPLDDYDRREIERERNRVVRRKLGWE